VAALTFGLSRLDEPRSVVSVGVVAFLALFTATGLVAGGRSVLGVWRLGQTARGQSGLGAGSTLLATLGNLGMATFVTWLLYVFIAGFLRWR
jgi:hypothetical protein